MDEERQPLCPVEYILLDDEEVWTTDTRSNMEESQKCAQWKNTGNKEDMTEDSIYRKL